MLDLKEQEKESMKNKSMKSDYAEEKVEETKKEKKEDVKSDPIISFDSFFQFLMKTQPSKVFAHHKAAMKCYAKQFNLLTGTKKQFEDLFKSY